MLVSKGREKERQEITRVTKFLNSIGRKSINTKKSYAIALMHLKNFIEKEDLGYDIDNIVDAILQCKINVYEILDSFISYIQTVKQGITPKTVTMYVSALRSYFSYYDVDIIPGKFKRKVMLPRIYREDEQGLDVEEIRKILLACSNRRLKAYLLVLASGAMRTVEALAIRVKDIDFDSNPTRIHLRKEYSKTRVGRDIYISNEATQELKHWLGFKYNNPDKPRERNEDDLVFTVYKSVSRPSVIYVKMLREFRRLLKKVEMDELKESCINGRHKITLHSFRRHAKTVIATQTNTDYSEYYLGHSKSPYWTMKESERRETYQNKIMPFLTFLDYSALENTSKGIVTQLENKDKEIAYLRERDLKHELEMKAMNERLERLDRVVNKIDKLEKELGLA